MIALPEEIDVTNSPGLRETLAKAISRHPTVVVADMTATTFCDSSDMGAIVGAYRQAIAAGTDLRLVIGHPAALRVFELNGIDTVISIYPDPPGHCPGPEQPRLRQCEHSQRPPKAANKRRAGRPPGLFSGLSPG